MIDAINQNKINLNGIFVEKFFFLLLLKFMNIKKTNELNDYYAIKKCAWIFREIISFGVITIFNVKINAFGICCCFVSFSKISKEK